ncbi:hypothetical protein ON010_g9703 [Phytophthora cinnamomi]|nr:hypothetical protein ON010_g9703 [Phytophthora cinnamomi]
MQLDQGAQAASVAGQAPAPQPRGHAARAPAGQGQHGGAASGGPEPRGDAPSVAVPGGPIAVPYLRLGGPDGPHCGPAATPGGHSRAGEQAHATEPQISARDGRESQGGGQDGRVAGGNGPGATGPGASVQAAVSREPSCVSLWVDNAASVQGRQAVLFLQEDFPEAVSDAPGGSQLGERDQIRNLPKCVRGSDTAVPCKHRKWKNGACRLKFNDDTYLIAREKVDPDGEEKVVRLLYLRFRLFEANGCYAIVTQSVPQDPVRYGGSLEKIWANDACMWNHFVPVVDENGEEHCEIHLTGCSAIGDPRSVRANVLETVMGLLRWENINVGPTLSLTQASTAENTPPEQAEGKPSGVLLSIGQRRSNIFSSVLDHLYNT